MTYLSSIERFASLASKRETDFGLFIKFWARFAGTVKALVRHF
jgi:hypothetical protein